MCICPALPCGMKPLDPGGEAAGVREGLGWTAGADRTGRVPGLHACEPGWFSLQHREVVAVTISVSGMRKKTRRAEGPGEGPSAGERVCH